MVYMNLSKPAHVDKVHSLVEWEFGQLYVLKHGLPGGQMAFKSDINRLEPGRHPRACFTCIKLTVEKLQNIILLY